MRAVLATVAVLSLGACASDGGYQTTTMVNGQSIETIDLTSPKFYMDDEDLAPYSPDAPGLAAGYCPACP